MKCIIIITKIFPNTNTWNLDNIVKMKYLPQCCIYFTDNCSEPSQINAVANVKEYFQHFKSMSVVWILASKRQYVSGNPAQTNTNFSYLYFCLSSVKHTERTWCLTVGHWQVCTAVKYSKMDYKKKFICWLGNWSQGKLAIMNWIYQWIIHMCTLLNQNSWLN